MLYTQVILNNTDIWWTVETSFSSNRSQCSVWLGSAFLSKNKVDDVIIFNQYLVAELQTLLSLSLPLLVTDLQCSVKRFKNKSK